LETGGDAVSERLTPERLRYIQALEFTSLDDSLTMLLDLLDHIDALEAENARLRTQYDELVMIMNSLSFWTQTEDRKMAVEAFWSGATT